MDLVPVSLEQLSDIRYSVALAPHARFEEPEFLYVSFEGNYRPGSSGAPDATFLMAVMAALDRAWYAEAFIVDFTELTYTWGDEMDWIWGIGWQTWCRCHRPLAIIVGDGCQKALRTLDPDAFSTYCLDSFDEALASVRRQKADYDACIKAYHAANRP